MAITKARMQVKRGNESDFDPSQMLPGEWAVSLDTKYVRMCFAPGICVRMATYDAFEADMEEIRDILLEAQTIQEAVARIQTEINDTAVVVEDYSVLSKSYAVGGTGKRENEDSDNAKYYYEQTKQISQGINGIVPMGTVAFADLPTSNIVNNAMYNVSNAFTSDARFNDGGGIYYGPGNNVIWTAEGKWDVTASSSVTGIKGSAESAYRVGNVNITPANIGLGNLDNTSDADKPISTATQAALDALNGSLNNYLPLAGGALKGGLLAQTISPSTPLGYGLGTSGYPWAVVNSKAFYARHPDGGTYGQLYMATAGTASTVGIGLIVAGNSVASGTDGNAVGGLRLYGESSGYTHVKTGNNTANNNTLVLPSSSGTVALTSDLPIHTTVTSDAVTIDANASKIVGVTVEIPSGYKIASITPLCSNTNITVSVRNYANGSINITAHNFYGSSTDITVSADVLFVQK